MHDFERLNEKMVIWLLLFVAAGVALSACNSVPRAMADYREVSVHAAVAVLQGEQRSLLSDMGTPDAVWSRPFGLYEWVYCVDGAPDRRFVFDIYGRLLGQGWGGDELLCVQAGWAPSQGDQT